jgi:hypothetical protein
MTGCVRPGSRSRAGMAGHEFSSLIYRAATIIMIRFSRLLARERSCRLIVRTYYGKNY